MDSPFVLGAIAAFVAAAGVWVWGEATSQQVPAPHIGPVRLPSARTLDGFWIPARTGKVRAATMMQLLLLAAVASLLLDPEIGWEPLAVLLVPPFVAVAHGAWRGRSDTDLGIALTPTGIVVRTPVYAYDVPWTAIGTIEVRRRRLQRYLCVSSPTSHPLLLPSTAIEMERGAAALWIDRLLLHGDPPIWLAWLALPPGDVADVTLHYFAHPDERARLAIRADVPVATTPEGSDG